MLASSMWPSAHDRHNTYLPPRPSPLSPRSGNIQAQYQYQSQPFDMPKPQTSPSRPRFKDVPFSKRPIKQNPFSQRAKDTRSKEAARETRRKLFLQQVAQKRDEQRFGERGEQLQRLDWRSDRRRWEEQQARNASRWSDQLNEAEVEDVPMASQELMVFGPQSQMSVLQGGEQLDAEEEAERLRLQEEEELEALLALREEQESQSSSKYGSDDEYDGLFDDLLDGGGGGGGVLGVSNDFVPAERQGDVDMSG